MAQCQTMVSEKRNRCRTIMERKTPFFSPHASDDKGDDAHDDEGGASDGEGEVKTVPYEEEENDDAEQHQFSVI